MMAHEGEDVAKWNRDTPWRQGHLLGRDAIEALGFRHNTAMPDQTIVIVATHDCDLAQAPEKEPRIEVIVGYSMEQKDGNYTHAKNARKLHVEFGDKDIAVASFWGEFEATAKTQIDKLKLNKFAPRTDGNLTPENRAIFQRWLASRYRRSAFPDEFQNRLTDKKFKLDKRIAKAVQSHGELIAGVFFDVDEGKDVSRKSGDPDDTYTLDITLLHTAAPDFVAAEKAAQEAATDIKNAFEEKLLKPPPGRWQYIELRSCDPVSESVLTYEMFRQLKQWNLEYISLAADPQQQLVE